MAQTDSTQAPDYRLERAAVARGCRFVAGVDEAGRGPLAGPVVAAAVVLDRKRAPKGLDDSKKLQPGRREALCAAILASCHVSVVAAPPRIIDDLNIRGATLWAMREAILGLACAPDHALIDGRDIPEGLPCAAEYVIGGDGRCLSIAAASIVAKVMRDRMCPVMDCDHPGFSFAQHKGYGTPVHLTALAELGPSPHHRASFAPVAAAVRTV